MATWDLTGNFSDLASNNYAFVKELWDTNRVPALRKELFDLNDRAALDRLLLPRGFEFPPNVEIVLVDIEGVRMKSFPHPTVAKLSTYVLLLPPRPVNRTDSDSIAMHTGLEAFFHASNDGYGM